MIKVLRPNGPGFQQEWSTVVPAGDHHSAINEEIDPPTPGDTSNYIKDDTSPCAFEDFVIPSIDDLETVTEIKIDGYMKTTDPIEGRTGLQIGYSYQPSGGGPLAGTYGELKYSSEYSWQTWEYKNLNISKSEMDSFQIRMDTTVFPPFEVYLATLRVVVTYTPKAGERTRRHGFMKKNLVVRNGKAFTKKRLINGV